MNVALQIQKALRSRIVASADVVALVPAANILDRNQQPIADPSIILGEDQIVPGNDVGRRTLTVYSTVHVWKREPSLEGVKSIVGAIAAALLSSRLDFGVGLHVADLIVSTTRFLRDPDGETSHGVLTVQMLLQVVT